MSLTLVIAEPLPHLALDYGIGHRGRLLVMVLDRAGALSTSCAT